MAHSLSVPDRFDLNNCPNIVKNNFRLDTRDLALRILFIAQHSPNPEVEGFVIGDVKDLIYESRHKIQYAVNRLVEVGLLEEKGRVESLMGGPKEYVLTELAWESIGEDVGEFALMGEPVGEEEETAQAKYREIIDAGYTQPIVINSTNTIVDVNTVAKVLHNHPKMFTRCTTVTGLIGLMGLQGATGKTLVEPVKARAFLEDTIRYFEAVTQILRQLEAGPYFKNGGDDEKREIYSMIGVDGRLNEEHEDSGLTARETLRGIYKLINDAKFADIVGQFGINLIEGMLNRLCDDFGIDHTTIENW